MAKNLFLTNSELLFFFCNQNPISTQYILFYINIVVVWELSLGMKAMLQNLNIQNADVG